MYWLLYQLIYQSTHLLMFNQVLFNTRLIEYWLIYRARFGQVSSNSSLNVTYWPTVSQVLSTVQSIERMELQVVLRKQMVGHKGQRVIGQMVDHTAQCVECRGQQVVIREQMVDHTAQSVECRKQQVVPREQIAERIVQRVAGRA